jgi:hypothetical protein
MTHEAEQSKCDAQCIHNFICGDMKVFQKNCTVDTSQKGFPSQINENYAR